MLRLREDVAELRGVPAPAGPLFPRSPVRSSRSEKDVA